MTDQELIELALEARHNSYAPYSHFNVGAALCTKDGKVYTGCNIENVSFGMTICAERVAVFKAISDGIREFDKIAIVGGKEGSEPTETASPCGACRQVLREFCDPDSFRILLGTSREDVKGYLLEELLPESFGPSKLQ